MMKNALYFTIKSVFDLKIFKFLSQLFGHAEKRFDQKVKVNFKIYDVTSCVTGNCNGYITQYLTKQRQREEEIRPVNRI